MKYREEHLHCGDHLLVSLQAEVSEISKVIHAVEWATDFTLEDGNKELSHQRAYNRAFQKEFSRHGWEAQPKLKDTPRLIGDFRKDLVFVEIQFGNSSALYRDFYKFQYGLQNGLLSLAVLVVPDDEHVFFPTRPASVSNMANFGLALTYFTVLPVSVPTWLIGLLPEN